MGARPAIPAEVRRAILVEAGHRCAIHSCRASASIDIHHIVHWEKCREHKPDNLIALCPSCHRLAHDGKIDNKALRKYKDICQQLTLPPLHDSDASIHAYIKFNPNTLAGNIDAKNIFSFVDNGDLDFEFMFEEGFEDTSYVIGALGDGTVNFMAINKLNDRIRIRFYRPCPDLVKLEFKF